MIAFLAIAVLMTLLAIAVVIVPLFREDTDRSPIAAIASALTIPAAVVLLYAVTSNYPWPWIGTGTTDPAVQAPSVPVADTADIAALKAAIAEAPQDASLWSRLADEYLAQERFSEAREAYREAISRSGGGDDALRLALAEASILTDRNALLGEAGQIIDDVLYRDPFNPKALWYGGMVAIGRGDTETAKSHWLKLLGLSPPPRIRQIIEAQLAQLGVQTSPASPDSDLSIPVRVSLEPGLSKRVKPGATLFLIARAADAAGPPLAVIRRDTPTLPLDLEISDADSMVAGRGLAGQTEIKLVARLANNGEALAATGDVFGEVTWRPDADKAGRLEILMNQVSP